MKSVLFFNSSKRKKNTYKLLQQVEGILNNKNIAVEYIHLHDIKLEACCGCETCLRKDFCILKDDYKLILKKMVEADGIVIGAPVYLRSIPGVLKNLIDRTCKWYHRPELIGTPILIVGTSAYSGLKNVIKYLQEVTLQWGAIDGGAIVRNALQMDKSITEKEVSKFIKYLFESRHNYRPTLRQVIEFNTQKILAKKILVADYELWTDRNWMNNNYFYDCKMNALKKIVGKAYFTLLDKVIKKTGE